MRRRIYTGVLTISLLVFSSVAFANAVYPYHFYARGRYSNGWYWLRSSSDYGRWTFVSSNIRRNNRLRLTFDFYENMYRPVVRVPVCIYDKRGILRHSAAVRLSRVSGRRIRGSLTLRNLYSDKLYVVVKRPLAAALSIAVRRPSVMLYYSGTSRRRITLPRAPASASYLYSFAANGYRYGGWLWIRGSANYARWVFRYSGVRGGKLNFYFLVTNPYTYGSGYSTVVRVYIYDRYGHLSESGNVALTNRNPHHPYNTYGRGYTAFGSYMLRKPYRYGFTVLVRWPSSNGYHFAVSRGSVSFSSRAYGPSMVTLLPNTLAVNAHRAGEWYWIRRSGNYARWGFSFGSGRVLQSGAYLYIKALVFNPYTRTAGRMTRIKIYVYDGYNRFKGSTYVSLYNRSGYNATGVYKLRKHYQKGVYVLVRWPSSNHYYFAVKRDSLILKGYIR